LNLTVENCFMRNVTSSPNSAAILDDGIADSSKSIDVAIINLTIINSGVCYFS
jgi:hypothetical protein